LFFSTPGLDIGNYEWYILSIGSNPVIVEEFENVFGSFDAKEFLGFIEITEASIQSLIFGW